MSLFNLFLIGVGLSMDAFAVSVSNGLTIKPIKIKHALIIALFFGVAQGLMPFLGWVMGQTFAQYIKTFAPYVALLLLGLIGGKMLKEAFSKHDGKREMKSLKFGQLLLETVATSIDALAVGITFALSDVNILFSCSAITVITFIFSFGGVFIGKKFGDFLSSKAEIFGGIILIGIGIKIFLEGVIL